MSTFCFAKCNEMKNLKFSKFHPIVMELSFNKYGINAPEIGNKWDDNMSKIAKRRG